MDKNVKDKLREDTNKWIELDNVVTKLKHKIKQLEREKLMISDRIVEVMDEFEISDLNFNNQQIKYKVTRQKQCLSKKFLLENLTTFYSGNMEKALNMLNYLDSRRIEKTNVKLLNHKPKKKIGN
tara:strand:- start:2530 stop:2904 length:375 start_codon:yes stop_codon:yes gene_type:complete